MKTLLLNSLEINIKQSDITKETTDAIVNASNKEMIPGGGVDGAINRAAGPDLGSAQRKLGPIETGEAVITAGFALPAKYVIHTAGPIWHDGANDEEHELAASYLNSLNLAKEHKLTSISFPAISTGVYHFPLDLAVKIVFETLTEFSQNPGTVQVINLVNFDSKTNVVYEKYFAMKLD